MEYVEVETYFSKLGLISNLTHKILVYLFFLKRCTRQSPAESDDTRGCIYTITT